MKGYGGTILSVAANSSILLRHFAERSSPKRKKRMKERVNAPRLANLCEFKSRLDTRGLAVFLKLSRFCFENIKRKKKNVAKKWDYSAPISRRTLEGLRNKTMLNKKVNFKKGNHTHVLLRNEKFTEEKDLSKI